MKSSVAYPLFKPLLVICVSINLVTATNSVRMNATIYDNKLTNILLDITKHFASGLFIHIIMTEDYSSSWFWGDLLKRDLFEKWSIVITNPNKQVYGITAELPDIVLIFFRNYQHLIELCNSQRNRNATESWNPGAKFLLVTAMSGVISKPAMDEFVINIFNALWSRNEIRLSLVILNTSVKTASLFSSSPYSKVYKTCKKIVNFSQLQEINLVNNVTSPLKIAGYQFEPPNSFLGCPLVAHTFPFPPFSVVDTSSSRGCRVYRSGIEVQLLLLLGNIHNFSLEILTTPGYGTGKEWFYINPNGSKQGMLMDVMQNKIDLAFAGVIPPSPYFFFLSLTNSYIDSSMSWYLPGAELVPMWNLVLNTFSVFTWLFILSLFLLVSMFYYHIMSGVERTVDDEPVFLSMVALSLGWSIPWTKRSCLRIMLIAWSLFCFHVVLMFNTRLFSVLTEHPISMETESLQGLQDSSLKTCTSSSYKSFYTNSTDGIMRLLMEKAHICDSLDESIKVMVKYKNFSILAKDDFMALKIDNKIQNVHRLRGKRFLTYPVVMPVAKGSAFLGVLNKLVLNITQAGLMFKWLRDVQGNLKHNFFITEEEEFNIQRYLMTKEDFIWMFYLLFGGHTISFMVFLLEIHIKSKH